ncbi:MAG: TolC family protein [Polyangiaceae bacterium]|nr:TolC family protein [Polyangiaceae bacterium]
MRKSWISGLLLPVALATTAVAQPERPPVTPPAAPTDTLEPKLPEVNDPLLAPLGTPSRVLGSWQEAIRVVRGRSTQLSRTLAQVELANGQARQALARALPTLTATGQIQRHMLTGEGITFGATGLRSGTIPDPQTTYSGSLGLRVPVIALRAWHDHGTARRGAGASGLSREDVERRVLGAVAEAIVNVVTAERLAEISRISLKSTLSTLELNKRRAQLGAASALDVLRAEQEVSITRAQVVGADEGVRRAREALGVTLGYSDPWGVTPQISLDQLAVDAQSVCRAVDDPNARADVRAARARLEIARRNVDGVSLDFVPTVDFVSNLNYLSLERQSPNNRHVNWTIGGVLTWPLYDGGLRYGTKMTTEAQLRLAQEDVTDAQRGAQLEAAQARRAVAVARQNLAVSQSTREIARKAGRLSRIAFAAGQGSSFDLIDSSRRLREAEIDTAIKEFELVRAQIAALLASANCKV